MVSVKGHAVRGNLVVVLVVDDNIEELNYTGRGAVDVKDVRGVDC
jgi:hypothetical protein